MGPNGRPITNRPRHILATSSSSSEDDSSDAEEQAEEERDEDVFSDRDDPPTARTANEIKEEDGVDSGYGSDKLPSASGDLQRRQSRNRGSAVALDEVHHK